MLTLFYRFFRPIVEAGHVYAAQPPLFCIKHGKVIKYVLNAKCLTIDLKMVAKNINVKKRRIYDITNVLEGK